MFSTRKLYLSLIISLAFFSHAASALPIFINELHYDNVGSDTGEAVEIAGVAGIDLSGWSLDFYNGNDGHSYMTWNLSGVITDQSNGYGALGFTGNSRIQNGTNDAIALIDNFGQVVQFLSYEGQLTAMSGSAQGQNSTDIGVAESNNTPVGYSLQLTGNGANYNDFTWQAAASSFGSVNANQTFFAYSVSEPNTLVLLMVSLCLILVQTIHRNMVKKRVALPIC